MKPDAFRHELEATYEKLGRQMPEIRFKGEKVKPTARRPWNRPRRSRSI